MQTPTVRIKLRVRLPGGTRVYLDPVFTANQKLRPQYANHNGLPVHFADGVYALRYLKGDRRVWEAIGKDAQLALTMKLQRERALAAAAVGVNVAGLSAAAPTTRRPLTDSIVEYLDEINVHKQQRTYAAYSRSLLSFTQSVLGLDKQPTLDDLRKGKISSPVHIEELTTKIGLQWIGGLKARGNSQRTLYNRATHLNTFRLHYGLPALFLKKTKPAYTEKRVLAYNEQVLEKLLEHATEDEKDLLYFFLSTGGRDQEASYVCWTDMDFVVKLYKVTEHWQEGANFLLSDLLRRSCLRRL